MKPLNKLISILKDYPLAVFCVLVILVCGAAIVLRGNQAVELSAKEADLKARINIINQNTKSANNLNNDVEALKVLVEQVQAKLFNRQQRALNINFFYELEDRMDIRLSSIGQMPMNDPTYAKGGPRELKLHSTIGYNISVNGNFAQVLKFLYELHRVDPLIRVADYRITASNARDATTNGSLETRLKVLVLAEKD